MWYVKSNNLTVTVMEGLYDANHVAQTHLATDETSVTDEVIQLPQVHCVVLLHISQSG